MHSPGWNGQNGRANWHDAPEEDRRRSNSRWWNTQPSSSSRVDNLQSASPGNVASRNCRYRRPLRTALSRNLSSVSDRATAGACCLNPEDVSGLERISDRKRNVLRECSGWNHNGSRNRNRGITGRQCHLGCAGMPQSQARFELSLYFRSRDPQPFGFAEQDPGHSGSTETTTCRASLSTMSARPSPVKSKAVFGREEFKK